MASVMYDHVTKEFGDVVAVNDLNLEHRRQGIHRPRRSFGLREDDRSANARRLGRNHQGRSQDRRSCCERCSSQRPGHRHGVPVICSVSAYVGLR